MDMDLTLEEFEVVCSESLAYLDKTNTQIKNAGETQPTPPTRTIKVWKLSSEKTLETAMPIVISSGFGRAMDQMGALATNLVANGVVVYRYDSLDHAGMSDGQMLDFTLSTGLQSLASVVNWVANRHQNAGVGLMATSLTARIAYRLASLSDQISFLVTAVGVVNIRQTLVCVMGEDYTAYKEEDLPPTVKFERQPIGTRTFYNDSIINNWLSKDETLNELHAIDIPIVAFIASEDEWVDRAEIEDVINPQSKPNRSLYIMEDCEHNFGKNLRSMEYFIKSVVDIVFHHTFPGTAKEFTQIDFEEILNQSIKERRIQRAFKRIMRAKNSADTKKRDETCVV